MQTAFALLVIAGFICHFVATFPVSHWANRAAWGCWLAASVIWFIAPSMFGMG